MQLHRLAAAFLGIGKEAKGDEPYERLRSLVGTSDEAIRAVRAAFARAAFEEDTPTEQEIHVMVQQLETHLSALPCIAGLADAALSASNPIQWRSRAQIRRAVAFFLSDYEQLPKDGGMLFLPIGNRDKWFTDLCAAQPAIVADVYVQYASAAWAGGHPIPAWLTSVTCDQDFDPVARLITIPLLQSFPIRSKNVYCLRLLLHAALRVLEHDQIIGIIRKKLNTSTMTVTQRGCWLAAGLFVVPEVYADDVVAYVEQDENRVEVLVRTIDRFPCDGKVQPPNLALELMVRLIGPFHSPGPLGTSSKYVHRRAQALVMSALRALAVWPTTEMHDTFTKLANESRLVAWHPVILEIAEQQRKSPSASR